MRAVLLALLLWQVTRVAPEPKHFRFERGVQVAAGASGRVCAALDAEVFAHSAGLSDVRLFGDGHEVPYALMASQTEARSEVVPALNLGERGGHIVFDLEMPSRAYSTVDLKLGFGGRDFLATAKVRGESSLSDRDGTSLGTYTLFDLEAQRLGRSFVLTLPESTFPYLHVDLAVSAAPGRPAFQAEPAMVDGAEIPPSREGQVLYTPVAQTTKLLQMADKTVAVLDVPAHVPVERVSFELVSGDKTNFSRTVRITARAGGLGGQALDEEIAGEISRVKMTEDGKEIRVESLAVPATLGSNEESAARVEVAVENEDDKPVAIRAVRLEMRQRKLCFDAPQDRVTMYYGDAKLSPPVYDYSRLFDPGAAAGGAQIGPEAVNPEFTARAEPVRPLTERHPEILWVALLGVVAALGAVAFRSAKKL